MNLRLYFSFGSVWAALFIATFVMSVSYLRRGVVLSQAGVEKVILDTPRVEEAVGTTSTSARPASANCIPSALITVPLVKERQSLLG